MKLVICSFRLLIKPLHVMSFEAFHVTDWFCFELGLNADSVLIHFRICCPSIEEGAAVSSPFELNFLLVCRKQFLSISYPVGLSGVCDRELFKVGAVEDSEWS